MTPTTKNALSLHAALADLPAVAGDALEELVMALGDLPPTTRVAATAKNASRNSLSKGVDAQANDVAAARAALAEELRGLAEALGDLARRPCEATLVAVSAATLAEAHCFDHEPSRPACRVARDVATDLLRRHGPQLRRRVRRLLQAVVDGVATEGGRRQFVSEVRTLIARARRWKPTCLDVDASMAIRVGGLVVTYRTSRELENGQRCLGTATLATTNLEGRLVLLMGDGRAPETVHASTVSRVSGAVGRVTNGVVKVVRDARGRPCFEPALAFTPRARRLAQTVRSLHVRPRLKRKAKPNAAYSPKNSA